jgi:hypothetical protein
MRVVQGSGMRVWVGEEVMKISFINHDKGWMV